VRKRNRKNQSGEKKKERVNIGLFNSQGKEALKNTRRRGAKSGEKPQKRDLAITLGLNEPNV